MIAHSAKFDDLYLDDVQRIAIRASDNLLGVRVSDSPVQRAGLLISIILERAGYYSVGSRLLEAHSSSGNSLAGCCSFEEMLTDV